MRIAILVYGLHAGGQSRTLCQLANGLAARGHQVSVSLLAGQPVAYPLQVPVHRLPRFRAADLPQADLLLPASLGLIPVAREVAGAITAPFYTRFEPDLVYDHRTAAQICGLPIPAIATSGPVAERIQQLSGYPCYVARPGVDTGLFHPAVAPAGRRTAIGYLYRPEAIGYRHKGQADLFSALELVRQHEPSLSLRILAPDGLPIQTTLPHSIITPANDREIATFYRESGLFVSAARSDGYQLAVLEAMACGVPVVLTDALGVRDYAVPGRNCFMGLAGNVTMLADLLLAAIRRPDMCDTFVANGLETARERSWERFVTEAEQALQHCLAARR